MAKYRKKPVEVEAMKFTSDTKSEDVIKVFGTDPIHPDPNGYWIPTLDGVMKVIPGDYIIKDAHGEFYPCKPDIFERFYEPVSDDWMTGTQHTTG